MTAASDFLDAASLRATMFVRHVELYDSLPSTNDRAIERSASADLATPALIATRVQTAGRGRGRNTWWSADGALTFSLILDTTDWGILPSDWPRMSLTTAVAVCDALECAGSSSTPNNPTFRIKWPNDVLVDGRKVCGILVESPGGVAPAKDRLIVGVGINVNNSWRDAPSEAGPLGVALCDVTGDVCDLQSILVDFLRAFRLRVEQLVANDPLLPQAWQPLCSLTGREVVVSTGLESMKGVCQGIADDGALLLTTFATTKKVYSGTVRNL